MSVSQQYCDDSTPMGANLVADGATFRVWAPNATHVYVALGVTDSYQPRPQDELVRNDATGHWTGFIQGVADGARYRYFVVGPGGSGLKRDPWARELELHGYPNVNCVVRRSDMYPWHDQGFRPPAFNDLIVYQFHVGVFYSRDAQGRDVRPGRVSKFLDVLDRVEYLADLGVNAIQPLPLTEFPGEWGLGYNGFDLFSPEMDYCLDPADLAPYLQKVNSMLAAKGHAPLAASQLAPQVNQLKALVDVCHLYGLAVIADVVYNHAGGNFDAQSIDYFDFPAVRDSSSNLYFSDREWSAGRAFAYGKAQVRDFLINNAKMFLEEYHADGLRFDEVSAIDRNGGWYFCQDMTGTLRYVKPEAVQIAEYWGDERWLGVLSPPAGMGFDIGYSDLLREAVRDVLAEASGGAGSAVRLEKLRAGLERPFNFPSAWQTYNCLENHDLVLNMDGDGHRKPRIPRLADSADTRSWYARSRARVAAGLLLTAPGVPMLFMGQEFLEDKLWSDDPHRADLFIWWDGLEGQDRHMGDFHRFTRDLAWLRRRHPALRSEPVNVFHVNEPDRVLAFHRWVPGAGRDVVVIISLREQTFYGGSYRLGFPLPGRWLEVFNGDAYDNIPNLSVQGNAGSVYADGPPLHDMPHSAGVTIPANGVLVFARDVGD
jgi:1,4-alpha-glucan branching enzyme